MSRNNYLIPASPIDPLLRLPLSQRYGILALGCVLLLRVGSTTTADLAYLFLAGYAFSGRPQVVQALLLSWLITMINPGIAAEGSYSGIGRYAVLFASLASMLWHNRLMVRATRLSRPIFWTLAVGAFILTHSILFSTAPQISILKVTAWLMAIATLFSAWNGMRREEHVATEGFVFFVLAAIAILSVPLVGTPLGMLRNGTGLQGVLSHPQVFGPSMGLLSAWTISKIVAQPRARLYLFGLGAISLLLVALSESRTAGVAAIIGISGSLAFLFFSPMKDFKNTAPGIYDWRFIACLALLVFLGILFQERVVALFDDFITKSGRATASGVVSAYEHSRGALIETMIRNVSENPWTGIGFGVASDPSLMKVVVDPVLGLPIGAAVEKGVLPLVIYEELGLIWGTSVLVWILYVVGRAARRGIVTSSLALTVLFLNMGEAVLFSPGGYGLLLMILLSWAATRKGKDSENLLLAADSFSSHGGTSQRVGSKRSRGRLRS